MPRLEAWIAVLFGMFVTLYGIAVMVFAKTAGGVPDAIFWIGLGITLLGGICNGVGRQEFKRIRRT